MGSAYLNDQKTFRLVPIVEKLFSSSLMQSIIVRSGGYVQVGPINSVAVYFETND